ncbi:MAG: hypothetical protein HY327_07135 [Chloroflexi bacterium]|nr:hypothetical protein [Chloroflexota bacterium]
MTTKPTWQRDKRYVDSPRKLERSGDYVQVGEINTMWLSGYAEIARGHTQVELGWDARNHYLSGRRGRRAHSELGEYEDRLMAIISSPYQVHASHYRKRKRIALSERFDDIKRLLVIVELSAKRQVAHQVKTFTFKDERDFQGNTWRGALLWQRKK